MSSHTGGPGPELRKDPVLNRWVLISGSAVPSDTCPACQCVTQLDPEAARGAIVHPQAILDRKRVVDRSRSGGDLHMTMTGAGEHELLIEAREHGSALAEMPVPEVQAVLALYRERLLYLRQDNRFRYMTVVKNAEEGHAVSEAFAFALVPPSVREKIQAMQGHQRRTGSCAYCETVKVERNEKVRRIAESMRHVLLAPFAPRTPFEMLLLPKGHHADFAASGDEDLADLAAVLSEALRRLSAVHPGAKYRLVLETSPPDMGADLQQFHWHFEIHPLLPAMSSPTFSVIDTNAVSPEDAARMLREAVI